MKTNKCAEATIDPITSEVIRNSLESTTEEMGLTVQKLAHSLIFAECKDFSVGIFDADAQAVAFAQYTPGHQGGMQTCIEAIMREIPKEEMFPGDVIMMNDPYRGGLHSQDLTLCAPVFYEDRVIMFSACVAHRLDMGGMTPGSYCPQATEIYQEAIRFPPTKLVEKGKMREDILRIFLTNVRLPDDNLGDLQAQIAAVRGAERGVKRLVDKYGLSTFLASVESILNLTESRARDEIEKIPDGVYEFTDHIDHDGITDRIYTLHVSVEIKGSDVFVDFSGSDDQAPGFINSPYSLTKSNTFVAFMFWLDPSIPKNQGLARPIRVFAPLGTIFNPRFPAPVSGATTEAGGRVRELVLGALSKAVPERGIAGWSHTYLAVYLSGTDPKTGKKFIHLPLDGLAIGGGARANADGYMASNPASSNMLIPNMEIQEQHCPIRYLKREVPTDAGGDGKFRGGGGLEVEWEILSPMTLTLMSSRREYPPPGICGGGNGGPSEAWIWKAREKKEITLPQKITGVQLSEGDRLRIRTAGGGGYGDPRERDPEVVKKDLRLGFISPEKAIKVYGFAGQPSREPLDR